MGGGWGVSPSHYSVGTMYPWMHAHWPNSQSLIGRITLTFTVLLLLLLLALFHSIFYCYFTALAALFHSIFGTVS